VLSAQTFTTLGQSGVIVDTPLDYSSMALVSKSFQVFRKGKLPTFLDSGASDTMFVLKESFVDYKPIESRVGDSAKAKDGDFEIVGEGNIVQWYLIDGKEHKITYTRALHTPTLNANLVSISALDRTGLTTIFGGGKGITRKLDGTVVLAEKNVNGMYILETLNKLKHISQALILLSHGMSLEQWHQRLTHCSPLTIREMASNNMVDGLKISDDDLKGKCKDCIMGRQTHHPFDGETEKNLDPLNLVSFNLWEPSRTQSAGGKVYLIIIVDAGTSHKHGAYLADKSDSSTLEAFDIFRSQAETTTGRKICRLQTDGAFDTNA
jgi:GAG-pre-integrase domain